jgi:hypothetical protein
VLLADSEGGAGRAAGVLLAKGDDTLSRRVDDRFDTAARFLDSRNLRVAFRIGMSENLGDFSAWKRRDIQKTVKKYFKKNDYLCSSLAPVFSKRTRTVHL